MTILTRYTLKQIWIPALLAAVIISFVVLLGTIGQELSDLIEELPIAHVTMVDISLISMYTLPTLAGFILPVTFLLGIMLTFGRMAQTSELIAAKAAGIPLRRLVLPVVGAGLVLSGFTFFVTDLVQPIAYKKLTKLMTSDMPHRITFDVFPTGIMHEFGEWRVYIGHRDADKTLRNIIVLTAEGNDIMAYYAESARQFTKNGVSQVEMLNVQMVGAGFTNYTEKISKPLPTLKPLEADSERVSWNLARLLREEAKTQEAATSGNSNTRKELDKIRREIGDRLSFPLMCLAVSIVAAPLGARAQRSGRSYTFATGIAIVAVYFVIRSSLRFLAPDTMAMTLFINQIPNLVLFCAGIFFIWRVDRI